MDMRNGLSKFKDTLTKMVYGNVDAQPTGEREPAQRNRLFEHVGGSGAAETQVAKILMDAMDNEIKKEAKSYRTEQQFVSEEHYIEPRIAFTIFDQMYEQSSWVRAAVDVIVKAVTAKGWTLVPLTETADPANEKILRDFFSDPNPQDTFKEILDDITRDSFVPANSFTEIVFGLEGKPRELWSLDANTMRVRVNKHGLILGYVQVPGYGIGSVGPARVHFDPKEVMHIKRGTKGSAIYGLSPLVSLVLPVTVDKFAQVYNRAFFLGGAKFRVAFMMKDASPEQVERNRDYLVKRAKDIETSQTDLVLEGNVDVKQVSMSQRDMEFLDLREFTRNEILAVYGVPPAMVSIIETGNIGSGTGDTQRQNFYEETVIPFQGAVAAKITKQIIDQGFGIKDWGFAFRKRTIDEKQAADIHEIYLETGVLTTEEVRADLKAQSPVMKKQMEAAPTAASGEILKARRLVGPSKTIVNATSSIIRLENRFLAALERVLREIRRSLIDGLPKITSAAFRQSVSDLGPIEFFAWEVKRLPYTFKRYKYPETVKQLPELEGILAGIDEEKLMRVVRRFALESARSGMELTSLRHNLLEPEDLSLALEASISITAANVALNIRGSIEDTLRRIVIDSVTAGATSQETRAVLELKLNEFIDVPVRETVDAAGNKIRNAHTRRVTRRSVAEAITRSEASRFFNEGALDAFEQNAVPEVQWILANDACPICRGLSESKPGEKTGKTFTLKEARGLIPAHVSCRCTWAVVEKK